MHGRPNARHCRQWQAWPETSRCVQVHVAPAFHSPYGHVRAKACWVAGSYAGIKFAGGRGQGPVFERLFALVLDALHDPELPVRLSFWVVVHGLTTYVPGLWVAMRGRRSLSSTGSLTGTVKSAGGPVFQPPMLWLLDALHGPKLPTC